MKLEKNLREKQKSFIPPACIACSSLPTSLDNENVCQESLLASVYNDPYRIDCKMVEIHSNSIENRFDWIRLFYCWNESPYCSRKKPSRMISVLATMVLLLRSETNSPLVHRSIMFYHWTIWSRREQKQWPEHFVCQSNPMIDWSSFFDWFHFVYSNSFSLGAVISEWNSWAIKKKFVFVSYRIWETICFLYFFFASIESNSN